MDAISDERLAAAEARAKAAHEYEIDIDEGEYDCPLCNGDGYVAGVYFEHREKASTIGAFGIGDDLHLARAFVENAPRDVLDLVAEVRRLRALTKSGEMETDGAHIWLEDDSGQRIVIK